MLFKNQEIFRNMTKYVNTKRSRREIDHTAEEYYFIKNKNISEIRKNLGYNSYRRKFHLIRRSWIGNLEERRIVFKSLSNLKPPFLILGWVQS